VTAHLGLLAAPRRVEILRLVWREERSAGDIHRALGDVTFGAVSQHLGRLAAGGLVAARAEGRRRLYRARPEALGAIAPLLERMWSDALYRLKLAAELETRRRGPRPRGRAAVARRRRPRSPKGDRR
jgi:DNA-binding transcriptional ArsR family regulator